MSSPSASVNAQIYPEFLGTLAHELRNALAPIRISMHVVKLSSPANPNVDDSFAIIERQMRSFIGLIDDIHDISRFARHIVVLKASKIALADIIESAVSACRPQLEAAEQKLSLELPPVTVLVEADYDRLQMALVKVVQNAAKYSLPEGQVTVRCHSSQTHATVHVIDTGIGIASDMLERVFDLFHQLNDPQAHQRGGLGIGLTLAREIVRLHGGTIEARSQGAGKGSEFLVSLPLAKEA